MSFARALFFGIATLSTPLAGFASEGVRMFDSGYAPQATSHAWWVNDEQLLFASLDRPNPVDMKDVRPALLIWELGTQPRVYKTGVDVLICFREGRLIYVGKDPDTKTRMTYFGQMGSEKPLARAHSRDLLNCEPRDAATVKDNERIIRSLRHDHGYLDFGLRTQPEKERTVFFHPRDGSNPVHLPFIAHQFFGVTFDYYPFRGAYFLPISRQRKPGEELLSSPVVDVAYWLWPNGKIEKVDMPPEISSMYPTRAGFVYRVFDKKSGGLYLMKSKHDRQRLIKGSITELTVSPSGCKVAFRYAVTHEAALWKPNKPTSRTLRVASLCN